MVRAAELVAASGGRALVLLATHKALKSYRQTFAALAAPYPVRFQGDDTPAKLIQWLKTTPGAVLVGTKTFWQGVNVPGEALSLIVVDKVPFPNPKDPVIAKLSAKMESESFNRVSLPRAGRDVAQGAADTHPQR